MDAGQAMCGVDFSGAKDAGDKLWVAKGVPRGMKAHPNARFQVRNKVRTDGVVPADGKFLFMDVSVVPASRIGPPFAFSRTP